MVHDLQSKLASRYAGEGFVNQLRAALVDSFRRLDALPRDDPFWEGTNHRPTLAKIAAFAEYLVESNAKDELALWSLAAMRLLYCCNDFGLEAWRRFHAIGTLDLAWPIYAAVRVRFDSGFDTAPALIHFLNTTGRCAEARNVLETLQGMGGEGLSSWAKAIATGCPVRIDPSWLTSNQGAVRRIAEVIGNERRFADLPLLADALEEAGCADEDILRHCRQQRAHVGGSWLIDLLLNKA